MNDLHGLLVLDKPGAMTSRAAVDVAQRWFPRGTKIGHTGTLDPLATGVLVLCLGNATRLAEYVQQMSKTYRTTLRLGATSDTDDADGAVTQVAGAVEPGPIAIAEAVATQVGVIQQTPPAYSAAKVSGRRAYALARSGVEVDLAPRTVRIDGIDLVAYAYPRLELEVRCGKGTYIRSLARDLGARLGCGALVDVLRRTRVGPFTPEQATPLTADAATARGRLLPVDRAVAELPRVELVDDDLRRLSQGQSVVHEAPASPVAVFDRHGRLAAIAESDGEGVLRPAKVLRDRPAQSK